MLGSQLTDWLCAWLICQNTNKSTINWFIRRDRSVYQTWIFVKVNLFAMSTVHKSWMLNHSAACQRNVFAIGLFTHITWRWMFTPLILDLIWKVWKLEMIHFLSVIQYIHQFNLVWAKPLCLWVYKAEWGSVSNDSLLT